MNRHLFVVMILIATTGACDKAATPPETSSDNSASAKSTAPASSADASPETTETAPPAQADEGKAQRIAVRECFAAYRKAVLDADGKASADLVTTSTLDVYQKYMDHAMTSDRKTVEALPLTDRLVVLSIRHRIPTEDARKMNGRRLFEYGVENGWIGKSSVIGTKVRTVEVADGHASAAMMVNGREAPFRFRFELEDGQWRFDLTSIMTFADTAFKAAAQQSGQEENEFLNTMLEGVSRKPVADSVWEPIGETEG
ncbi:MAG TPA: hypothetical protein P5081_21410 [Phycisphaerae bacterium]|nr:hypothetical protein [Phycisphaerae bacterium]HRW55440.1 hypothetical protein [Phycisphaerae bacterium]